MNIWQQHVVYLQDNPEGYWFKRKLYGWGWTPARLEGWAVLLIWLAVVIRVVRTIESRAATDYDALVMLALPMLLLVAVLVCICWLTGESPQWQWGIKKDE